MFKSSGPAVGIFGDSRTKNVKAIRFVTGSVYQYPVIGYSNLGNSVLALERRLQNVLIVGDAGRLLEVERMDAWLDARAAFYHSPPALTRIRLCTGGGKATAVCCGTATWRHSSL